MLDLLAPANFSPDPDRRYRWSLSRRLSIFGERPLVCCGYNPSDANEVDNDPTIGREIALAHRLRCDWLVKVNLFGRVSSKPDALADCDDPVGELADEAILAAVALCRERDGVLLACWGAPKGRAVTRRLAEERCRQVAALTRDWQALRITKGGHPEHPLYLSSALMPKPWPGYSP